jgi:hypothetical protein
VSDWYLLVDILLAERGNCWVGVTMIASDCMDLRLTMIASDASDCMDCCISAVIVN